MGKIDNYINSITNQLNCSKEERDDLRIQFADHLNLLKNEYVEKGYSEDEAIDLSIKDFGNEGNIVGELEEKEKNLNKGYRIFFNICFGAYILLLVVLFLNPLRSTAQWVAIARQNGAYFGVTVNIIPFKTIINFIIQHNFLGRIAIFIPLGILLPLVINRGKVTKISIRIALLIIFTIEILRLIFPLGVSDIDHIILHTVGACIGFFFYYSLFRNFSFIYKN